MTQRINSYFSTFDKLEDLVKSYKERRGGLCCKLVSNFVDPPDDYGPVIDYEGQGSTRTCTRTINMYVLVSCLGNPRKATEGCVLI